MAILDRLTKEAFSKYIGDSFDAKIKTSGVVPLELVQVIGLNRATWQDQSNQEPKRESFSIVFRGPRKPILAQGMYEIGHDKMGDIENLFLVPIGIDEQGRYYEAIFN